MSSWLGTPEFKVGFLVVVVSGLIGVMAMKVAQGPGLFSGQKRFYFRADSAGGLVQNSAVKMAGIKIGVIRDIVLEDGRARIVVTLDGAARVTEGTVVEFKADGILGDKHIELIPGKVDAPEVESGSELPVAKGKGSVDDVMTEVTRVAKSMNELMSMLNKAASEGDNSTRLGRIIGNIEQITEDLKSVSSSNRDKLDEILDRVHSITRNIDTYVNEESLARVDRSLKNIEDITQKINNGEGTLGHLINDDRTVTELNSAITNVNNFLGGAQRMETSIDFHSEFMSNNTNRSFFGVRIRPGLDRYYEAAAVSDTYGVSRVETLDTNTNGVESQTVTRKTSKNEFKLTLLFAKNFWDFTIKGGLIQNFGGLGVDYRILGYNDLILSTEFFNFNDLQIRSFLRYNVFRGLYFVGGADNVGGGETHKASGFVGAGIFITNDDLKAFASRIAF